MNHSSSSDPKRERFWLLAFALTALSVWRVLICLLEYDHGPHVSLSRTVLDLLPFVALAGCIVAAYWAWNGVRWLPTACLLVSSGALCLATADLVRFNWIAREQLYTGRWSGIANVAPPGVQPIYAIVEATYTESGEVVVVVGPNQVMGPNPTTVFRGSWRTEFNRVRCNQSLALLGFGHAEYWNLQNLDLKGTYQATDGEHQLAAQLKQFATSSDARLN